MDMYLGMLNALKMTGNAAVIVKLNMAAIYSRTVYLPIIIGIILQDESHLNEMEI